MSRILWLCWDGGGNLNPSLGVARALSARGHSVTFAGRPEMIPRVADAGFKTIELKETKTLLEKYPAGPLKTVGAYLTSPRVGQEVVEVVRAQAPDVVVIDCMFPAALNEAKKFGRPTAAMMHTFFNRMEKGWKAMTEGFKGMREKAGFEALPSFHQLWAEQDVLVVNTFEEFDQPAINTTARIRYAGPVLEQEKRAVPLEIPVEGPKGLPLVLMSFSTVTEQRMVDNWQRALNALESLPVRVVGTTGGLVDPAELTIPKNATVVKFASHEALMKQATMVVTHGGHGTAMRSLSHGLPMVLIPALAADQPVVAAAVQEWGAGLALPSDASVEAIRAAVVKVLEVASYRENARKLSMKFAGVDGATRAAVIVEELLKGGAKSPGA